MTEEIDRDFEGELASLTTWRGGETALWKSALAASGGPRGRRAWFLRPWSVAAAAAIIIVVIGAIVAGQLGRRLGVEAVSAHGTNLKQLGAASVAPGKSLPTRSPAAPLDSNLDQWWAWTAPNEPCFSGIYADVPGEFYAQAASDMATRGQASFDTAGSGASPPSALPSDRRVVRKATMELATADVRGTYEKAMQLTSTARGEYVQAASIGGDDERPWAQLTLRVAAERLDEVLNRLRSLGVVRTEQSEGDDVTSQVVDLEARLRNERRIEQELLELMDGREKDPIKDILELRTQLGAVRQYIESLEGQRQHLDRLVSLATVLVIIRPETDDEQAAQAPGPQPIVAYFGDSTSRAWRGGLLFLADTVAGLIRVIVGGLVWWIGAVIVITIAYRAWRRHKLFGSA